MFSLGIYYIVVVMDTCNFLCVLAAVCEKLGLWFSFWNLIDCDKIDWSCEHRLGRWLALAQILSWSECFGKHLVQAN